MIKGGARLEHRRRPWVRHEVRSRPRLGVALAFLAILGVSGMGMAEEEQPDVSPGQDGWANQRPPVIRASTDGGSTRIMGSFDITQKRDEELFPRSKKIIATIAMLSGESSVSKGAFERGGGSATVAFSTSRPTPFDEMETSRHVEVNFGYLLSYVDYTDSFMYLLDAGGQGGFGRQATELRTDISVSAVNRVHSTGGFKTHLLFGTYWMWLTSDTRGVTFPNEYAKLLLGPGIGLREVFTKRIGNDQTLEFIGEVRYIVNLMTFGRIAYRPPPPNDLNPYPLYVDAISDMQRFKLGLRYGKLGGNFSLEASWVADIINSGGTVDDLRIYQGFTVAGVYHF